MNFVIYTADCTGNKANCDYPHRVEELMGQRFSRKQSKKIMSALNIKVTTEARTIS